jgi:hypothetical protein
VVKTKETTDLGVGSLRVVSGGGKGRLVFSQPIPGRRREKQFINRRLDAAAKLDFAPSVGGKAATLTITLVGGDGLERYTVRVKTDAQAQAILDAARKVAAA